MTDNIDIRRYNHSSDLAAVKRIWRECGWVEDEDDEKAMAPFFSVGTSLVATIDGVPECVVHHTPGTMQYLDSSLELGAVTAVTTSHIARKLGLAKKLTARLLQRQAEDGMALSALGMFEQGFYNLVGYGTGSRAHIATIDPALITVDCGFRVPKRLSQSDHEAIHGAMVRRHMNHGAVRLSPPEIIEAELQWTENPFGLGYCDCPDGSLSHFIWGSAKGENGPYRITFMAYENDRQLLELLALIRSLGDQVNAITLIEPPELVLQDILKQPFKGRRISRQGEFEQRSSNSAYWQARMLDVERCVAAVTTASPPLRFNLTLSDPLAHMDLNWDGVGGDYIVDLSESSWATRGTDVALPTLTASVGAFSRLWLGARSASMLALTDDLVGDDALIHALDRTLRLPEPHLGWDF